MRNAHLIVAVLALPALPCTAAQGPNILYLTKSVDFEHSPVAPRGDKLPVSYEVLTELAGQLNGSITCTKDASLVNAENLKNYQLVILYTQGDLTVAGGKDGAPGMPETGVTDLIGWIKQGGGFMGFHSATDTFDTNDPEPSPYIKMIGAEFRGHGGQFAGNLRVVDPTHPTMKRFPAEWSLRDEWYLFRKFNKDAVRVLVIMDPGDERAKQEMYNIPPYPVVWCSELGKGRVYSSALGHRDDVWTNPTFKKTTLDAMKWALGKGKADAEPNFDEVVPTAIPEEE